MSSNATAVITPEMTLNDIMLAVPRAVEVFNKYGLDSCCGGAKALALVCEKHGLDREALLRELRAL